MPQFTLKREKKEKRNIAVSRYANKTGKRFLSKKNVPERKSRTRM